MTETPVEPAPLRHAWLPLHDVGTPDADTYTAGLLTWLQLPAGNGGAGVTSPLAGVAELCRRAAARYCERQRPDLFPTVTVPDTGELVQGFAGDDDTIMAGLILAARLYARRSSPAGLASFGELGAAEVLRLDPDVGRLLGTGRHATPAVG